MACMHATIVATPLSGMYKERHEKRLHDQDPIYGTHCAGNTVDGCELLLTP